jgi:predicted dehydrogenase
MSEQVADRAVRIGVLGAAGIVKSALLKPAASVDGVQVAAIAARDRSRAGAYAAKHGIPLVHASYRALVEDPDIDAVYIPLPAALHAPWSLAAIEAGKHVLCEKPFTSNAAAAAEVAAAAKASELVVMEAYHSHYHPLRRQLQEILASGELGDIQTATATACAPIPPGADIRWNFSLGGGGLLDVGYYPLRLLRALFGEVGDVTATTKARGQIDGRLEAELVHVGGVTSRVVTSLWSWPLISMYLDVQGSRGRMRVGTPYHPQMGGRIRIETADGRRVERPDRRTTYEFQLLAFADAVRTGAQVPTGVDEATRQLLAIDRIYQAAGLSERPSVPRNAIDA